MTADKTEFENPAAYTQENTEGEIHLGDSEQGVFDKSNCSYDFAIDSADKEAVLSIYLNQEQYASISEDVSVKAEISSTKEVERIGFKYFSLIVAVIFFAFIFVTCAVIKEKSNVEVQNVSVKEMFKALLQNDQAMAMVITIVMVNSATYITSNLLIYFFKYDLGGANWQGNYTLFTTFGGGMQIIAMMAFFPLLRKFFSTMKMFYVCIFTAIGGYIILLGMALGGVNSVYPFFVPGFFIFATVGILNVLVTIYLANTVDYGELKNNRRDESVIFSMQTFVVKLASGIAALVASLCLQIFNISESESTYEAIEGSYTAGLGEKISLIMQNGSTAVSNNSVIGLRCVMTILPIIVLVIAFFVYKAKYILSDEKLAEITKQLAAKREADKTNL
ncbi:MAG: MFS transporter [Lachnospiraceae bacterium]|nr:MFS transporter [Lachnospiraceae bacterium]